MITLRNVMPEAFGSGEHRQRIAASQIWGRDKVEFLPGKTYLVEAASGTGKTSLCSFLIGDRTDYTGTIDYGQGPVGTLGIDALCAMRRHTVAYLPQELNLFPSLSAIDNVSAKALLTGTRCRPGEIEEMLARVGITQVTVPVGRLSVGQQQRVALVRALCQPFSLLLLDEPVSHLDEASNRAVARLIDDCRPDDATVIVTSVGQRLLTSYDYVLTL